MSKPILPPNLFVGDPIRSTDTLGINVQIGTPEEPHEETIAEVLPGTPLQREQAEEIVRRCNAFPELLAALEQCLPIIDAYRRASLSDGDIAAMNARAAIAKSKGQL